MFLCIYNYSVMFPRNCLQSYFRTCLQFPSCLDYFLYEGCEVWCNYTYLFFPILGQAAALCACAHHLSGVSCRLPRQYLVISKFAGRTPCFLSFFFFFFCYGVYCQFGRSWFTAYVLITLTTKTYIETISKFTFFLSLLRFMLSFMFRLMHA